MSLERHGGAIGIRIFAHRGNLKGPNRLLENSPSLVASALAQGFDLETDIRRDAGGTLYISHDRQPRQQQILGAEHAAIWRLFPNQIVALNVKELGYEDELLRFIVNERLLNQVFLFDMELLEKQPGDTARLFNQTCPALKLAARISDRNEPIERALSIEAAEIIWLDEFDSTWATANDLMLLRAAGKTIYAISPDVHGASLPTARQRWSELINYGVHGIVTDWPIQLAQDVGASFANVEGISHACF